MRRLERIEDALRAKLNPVALRVEDQSAEHAGHVGAQDGGETHFRVAIVAAAFRGQSRVARQRLVYDALTVEFKEGLHALTVEARAPEE